MKKDRLLKSRFLGRLLEVEGEARRRSKMMWTSASPRKIAGVPWHARIIRPRYFSVSFSPPCHSSEPMKESLHQRLPISTFSRASYWIRSFLFLKKLCYQYQLTLLLCKRSYVCLTSSHSYYVFNLQGNSDTVVKRVLYYSPFFISFFSFYLPFC